MTHQALEERFLKSPSAVAITHDNTQITYQELNLRVSQLARHLQSQGLVKGQIVAVFMERSVSAIISLFAIFKAGGVYLPIDTDYPQARIRFLLEDSVASIILTHSEVVNRLNTRLLSPEIKIICIDNYADNFVENVTDNTSKNQTNEHTSAENSLAYVIYTSGSSGKPKGVLIEHKSIINFSNWAKKAFMLNEQDRVLQFASLSFDTSIEEIIPPLSAGATLVIRPNHMVDSIPHFLLSCGELEITVLDLPTAFWHELLLVMEEKQLKLPGTVRLVIIGGEVAKSGFVSLWRKLVKPQVRLINTYGPTESTVVSSWLEVDKSVELYEGSNLSIGEAIDNIEITIVDSDLMEVERGNSGEICISGSGLARGYWNRSELTLEKFITRADGVRVYLSGDIGLVRDDGRIDFLGRMDNQIKLRGHRIELEEIEKVLLRHPNIFDTAVMLKEDETKFSFLTAYIVGEKNTQLSIFECRNFLQQELPYNMIPSSYIFMEKFPVNINGKIDREALPEPGERSSGVDYVEPVDETSQELCRIWQTTLRVSRVGIEDDFFVLGGDSMLAANLIFAIYETFNVDISLIDLHEKSTVKSLSPFIVEKQSSVNQSEELDLQGLLQDIQNLSDDEVDAELQ